MQIVADYSCLVSGAVSKSVKGGEVVIPLSVISLLEKEMRANKVDGFVGTKELLTLKDMADSGTIELRFTGERPRHEPHKDDADWEAREVARVEGSSLMTCDEVQDKIARSLGISVAYVKQEKHLELSIRKFFDDHTMSVHIKEGLPVFAKKGKPGSWVFDKVADKPMKRDVVEEIGREIVEKAERNPMAFIEVDKEGATVVQYEDYRIVITRHPFSKGMEITAVRPVKKLALKDYDLPDELMKRFEDRAEGIVIAGSPGAGKTTMAQALAEFYASKKKIVKTIEHPRDLNVISDITQYGHLEGDPEGTGEVLLLVRPDFTVYDELRTTRDFEVYSDMRLAGVGMIGVVHASRAIDAIQRFLGRLEMGVIPQVLDTVIFLHGGGIERVYELEMKVKVPSGMLEADLARPVVEVKDFYTKKVEYEIYTYGEETTIVPVTEELSGDPVQVLAEKELQRFMKKAVPNSKVRVKFTGERSIALYVESDAIPYVIGKKGSNIMALEEELGLSIDVRDLEDLPAGAASTGEELDYQVDEGKKNVTFYFDKGMSGRQVEFSIDGEYLFSAVVSKKGSVRLDRKTPMAKQIKEAQNKGREVVVTA
jgi:ATPase